MTVLGERSEQSARKGVRVAVLEPYYGGSHAVFVDTIARYTRHRIVLATLPARKWKWRMRGAALWFALEDRSWMVDPNDDPIDLILANDMMSVADLRALLPAEMRSIPIACYFHENQLTYPVPPDQVRDYQYGMTNITSCLAADVVWFNSSFHLADFLSAGEALLRKMPDYVPSDWIDQIRRRSRVVPPPVPEPPSCAKNARSHGPLTILWCHRWEYDKNPEPFFDALRKLDEAGCVFNLVLVGEQFRKSPPAFAVALRGLKHRITHAGFVPDRAEYWSILSNCDVVVSTAIQENFGIGVIEAILAGCHPILPHRLVYPEIIPVKFHDACLYADDSELLNRLRSVLEGDRLLGRSEQRELRDALATRYAGAAAVSRLDAAIQSVVSRNRP